MVTFNLDHDMSDPDDECKEIINNVPSTILEMVESTKRRGVESAVGIANTRDGWFTTDITQGSESEMSGGVMQDIWLHTSQQAPSFNANFDEQYLLHTHPSGFADMSFDDVVSSIEFANKASPVTGNFVVAFYKGKVNISGLVLRERHRKGTDTMNIQEVKDAKSAASSMRSMVESGREPLSTAKQHLVGDAASVFRSCSYSTSLSDLENRARMSKR